MQEAIEKDMESINGGEIPTVAGMMIDLFRQNMVGEEDEQLLIDNGIKVEEEEKKSANQEDTQTNEKPSKTKEI